MFSRIIRLECRLIRSLNLEDLKADFSENFSWYYPTQIQIQETTLEDLKRKTRIGQTIWQESWLSEFLEKNIEIWNNHTL